MNSKLHAVCDGQGRPVVLLLTEGQMNHMGARLLVPILPRALGPLADRGCDRDRFRAELAEREIEPCIPSIPSRKMPLSSDRILYRQRHRIEGSVRGCGGNSLTAAV